MGEVDAAIRGSRVREQAPSPVLAIPLNASGTTLGEESVLDNRPAKKEAAAGAKAKGGQLIEPGRALALADFAPPSLGAGEKHIRLAYRIGVPGSALAAPFRKPAKVRLLATVANPLPGDKVAGTALRAGHFLVHGLKLPIAQVDFAGAGRLAAPVERVVHGFHWLADLDGRLASYQNHLGAGASEADDE